MKQWIFLWIILVMVFIDGFLIGHLFWDSLFNPIKLGQPDNNCSNLTLIGTSVCLESELSQWYKYNISNAEKTLSLEELKQQGGVCHHYAEWYYNQANNLGFNAEKVIIQMSSNISHEMTIISDETGYCVLDQTDTWCWERG